MIKTWKMKWKMKLWLLKNLPIKNSQGKKEDMGNYNLKNYSRLLFYTLNNLCLEWKSFLKIEGWDQKSGESEEKKQLMLCFILGFLIACIVSE